MACARILLVFGCFGTGPAGVRVFRNRTKALFFMGSKGDAKEFFGMRFASLACPASVRVFRNRTNSGVSEPYQSIVFYCFLWVPKVT